MQKNIKINVSVGELVDKITILEIKSLKIKDKYNCKIILSELRSLMNVLVKISFSKSSDLEKLKNLKNTLYNINLKLWKIEDRLRECESKKKFDNKFIELARNVYKLNDKRSAIKSKINTFSSSRIHEIKLYTKYK